MSAVLVSIFAALSVWSIMTPPLTTVDEPRHVNSVARLIEGGGWPAPRTAEMLDGTLNALRESGETPGGVVPLDQLPIAEDRSRLVGVESELFDEVSVMDWMNQHPPTYYAILAAALAPFADSLRWDQFVSAARAISALLVVGGVAFAMATVRRLTGSYAAAIAGGVAIFAVPQFFNVLSLVTNDALAVLAVSAGLFFVTRAVASRGCLAWSDATGAGVSLGVAILTKGTLLVAIPVFALLLVIACLRSPLSGRRPGPWLRAAASLAIAAAIGGWWWVRNLVVFGQIQSSNSGAPRAAEPFDGYDLWDFAVRVPDQLARTLWGSLRADLALPLPIIVGLTSLSVAALLLVLLRSGRIERWLICVMLLLPVLTVGLITANAWRVYWNTGRIAGIQGRYLFPWLVLFVVVVALVWVALVAGRRSVGGHLSASTLLLAPAAVQGFALTFIFQRRWESSTENMTRAGSFFPGALILLLGIALCSLVVAIIVSIRLAPREPASRGRGRELIGVHLRRRPAAYVSRAQDQPDRQEGRESGGNGKGERRGQW
jgi:hypothetical protein